MEMSWSTDEDLQFKVHLKPHQTLRYLNRFSCHRHSTFADIPEGVFTRLARLTTVTDETMNLGLDVLYPHHTSALQQAGLAPKRFPTLGDAVDLVHAREAAKAAAAADAKAPNDDSAATKPKTFQPGRDTFAKFGFCRLWSVPLHSKLKQLRDKHGLKWLRLRMAYHRYPNVNEHLQTDLTKKIMSGVESRDFSQSLQCNCSPAHKFRDGECIYNGDCRRFCTIYRATCRLCNKVYIGNTQQTLKGRFADGGGCHFNVIRKHANLTPELEDPPDNQPQVPSTTLSTHLVPHLHVAHHPRRQGFRAHHVRPLLFVDVIWVGNVINYMKTFQTQACCLCMQERYLIFKHRMADPLSVLNQGLGIHKGCVHKTKFHRFTLRSEADP